MEVTPLIVSSELLLIARDVEWLKWSLGVSGSVIAAFAAVNFGLSSYLTREQMKNLEKRLTKQVEMLVTENLNKLEREFNKTTGSMKVELFRATAVAHKNDKNYALAFVSYVAAAFYAENTIESADDEFVIGALREAKKLIEGQVVREDFAKMSTDMRQVVGSSLKILESSHSTLVRMFAQDIEEILNKNI